MDATATPAGAATVPTRADAIIHVATTGHDTARCGGAADPCRTIPYAYARAANGDTIQVAAGSYTLGGPLRIAGTGLRRPGARAGVKATTRTHGRPGKAAVTIAGPKPDPDDAPLAGSFSALVSAFLRSIHGHVSLATMPAPADLDAHDHGSSRQSIPQQICLRANHQTICLHFAVHPEVALLAKTAVPGQGHAVRSVTVVIITIISGGPAAGSGLAGAGGVHLDLRRQPRHGAHRPAGTTGHGCTAKCPATATIIRAPAVPVTG
jgi:hypothetical protein